MGSDRVVSEARLRRLTEELAEDGFVLKGPDGWQRLVLSELDYALRPPVHERRIPSYGAIVQPDVDPGDWEKPANLTITHRPVEEEQQVGARRFADGISTWMVLRESGEHELAVFDRPASSERDLVILAEAMGATLVQRHPAGTVRVAGEFGVLRWDRIRWHHEPPVSEWIDAVAVCTRHGDRDVLETLLEFAVHDLGSRGIGAILVYRPEDGPGPAYESRLPTPPPLEIRNASHLAPLRHVLAQVDGATVFDADGTMRELGVRLVPSVDAVTDVEGFRGMRHTSGRRYSYDDPNATVIVVSEDGPVTVLRGGEVMGSSIGTTSILEFSAETVTE